MHQAPPVPAPPPLSPSFGLVYPRWNLIGLLAFGAAQITALVGGVAIATATHSWPAVGHFFTTLSVTGLTGLLAALAAVLLAGGLTTVRRTTVRGPKMGWSRQHDPR